MSILGMHYTQDPAAPEPDIDWIRFWDNEVYWNRVHKGVDNYDWARLDYLVNDLYADKQIVYCIGGTPLWLAEDPDVYLDHPWMGQGSNSLPTSGGGTDPYGVTFTNGLDEWNKFCWNVATRYKGRIKAYELWNEPQLLGYMSPFNSTTRAKLAKMVKRSGSTMKSVDPNCLIISPSIFVGTPGRETRATAFTEAMGSTQGSFGPWANIDAAAVHIYPAEGQGKTQWRQELDKCRQIISNEGGPSKTWITETNYNLLGSVLPETQGTYDLIADTYAEAGGKYIFWYAWNRTADLGGLDIQADKMAYKAMVETTTGNTYPPEISLTITSSHTEWTGYEEGDYSVVTFNITNDSDSSVTITHNQGLTPTSTIIGIGGSASFSETIYTNPPNGQYTVTFTGTSGISQANYTVSEPIEDKPTEIVLPSISLQIVDSQSDWTGYEESDTMTFEFNVTNTSQSDTLTVTHNSTLSPASSTLSVSSSQKFTETINTRPATGTYPVTFTGTASDGRLRQYSFNLNVPAKPTPPPPPPEAETHTLHCNWNNRRNNEDRYSPTTVEGPAVLPYENCYDKFIEEYPAAQVGRNDWVLESYAWDEGELQYITNYPPEEPLPWPNTKLQIVTDLPSGSDITPELYRTLIIMEDGGTLNFPETIRENFQVALLCYNNPITLTSGKIDMSTRSIPVNRVTVVSRLK